MKTQVISSAAELQKICLEAKSAQKSIGLVPTMGALHFGHEALINWAKRDNDLVILSIFINPTQFNNPDDLVNYPKTWDHDLQIALDNKVDYLFFPNASTIYPDNYEVRISEQTLSTQLCGKDRPGHFDGVLTVVNKLFNITQATRSYFGEKDFQQLQLIKKMVSALFLTTEIIAVPTVRLESGLAQSSRNLRLTAEQLKIAPLLYHTITQVPDLKICHKKLEDYGFRVVYLEDILDRRYIAAFLGEVRLIDNVQIRKSNL